MGVDDIDMVSFKQFKNGFVQVWYDNEDQKKNEQELFADLRQRFDRIFFFVVWCDSDPFWDRVIPKHAL